MRVVEIMRESSRDNDSDSDSDSDTVMVKPSQFVHIGDDYVNDYCGARNVQWNAFLLQRDNDNDSDNDNDNDSDVVTSLMDALHKLEQRGLL